MSIGEVEGVAVGTTFETWSDLNAAGIHRQMRAGIQGSGVSGQGAESIVLSGRYEDDEDLGSTVLYTGHGGRDARTGEQVDHQDFTRLNKTLALNVDSGQPVRVVRRLDDGRYRYDGLFFVTAAYDTIGKSGFRICRFQLEAEEPMPSMGEPAPPGPAARKSTTSKVLVRDGGVAAHVKTLHEYRCQICGVALRTRNDVYAEAAHIRPLGRPHNGPDVAENVLCLCPNDHVLFDAGAVHVETNLDVRRFDGQHVGKLRLVSGHEVGEGYLAYHRRQFTDN